MDNRILYQKLVSIDNINERDFLNTPLSTFKMRRQSTRYRVIQEDLQRPDIISFKVYNNVNLWWFILYVNSVVNAFDEITIGQALIIPSVFDLYDFWNSNKKI